MIEDALINYGALGLWTISNLTLIMYLLKRDTARDAKVLSVVENNTAALCNMKTIIEGCKYAGRRK